MLTLSTSKNQLNIGRPGKIVMVRSVFHKLDSVGKWIRNTDTGKIPLSAVLPIVEESAEKRVKRDEKMQKEVKRDGKR